MHSHAVRIDLDRFSLVEAEIERYHISIRAEKLPEFMKGLKARQPVMICWKTKPDGILCFLADPAEVDDEGLWYMDFRIESTLLRG